MKKIIGKNKILTKILFIPILLLICALIGYFLLVGSYCLPTERMEKNMEESCDIFYAEGNYPQLMEYNNSRLDNYTDGIMLLTASYPSDENVWHAAINAERYSTSDTSVDTILDVYGNGEIETDSTYYARYWHGYLIILKPLLMIFGYGQIREIMMFVQLGLFALLLVMLSKKNIKLTIPVFIMWIFLNPVTTMLSLQFNTILTITFAAMLAILWLDKKEIIKSLYTWGLFFLIIGVLTSYFDLLTYPLVTLGVPLTLWFVLNFSERIRTDLQNLLQLSVLWSIGYGGMWAMKWIMGSIITGENVIGDAAQQVAYRTSSVVSDTVVTVSRLIHELQYSARQYTWILVMLLLALYFVYRVIRTRKLNINRIIIFVIISVFPMAWYLAMKNHTFGHHWFTYRELAISIYALSTCILIHGEGKNG